MYYLRSLPTAYMAAGKFIVDSACFVGIISDSRFTSIRGNGCCQRSTGVRWFFFSCNKRRWLRLNDSINMDYKLFMEPSMAVGGVVAVAGIDIGTSVIKKFRKEKTIIKKAGLN